MFSKIFKVSAAILIVLAFLYITTFSIDPDLGWHLRIGQTSLEQGTVPRVDQLSHTMPGFSWVDHEWLIEVLLAWMKSHALWPIVIIFFTFFAAAPFLLWLARARNVLEICGVLLAASIAINFIGVRPQMVSLFLFFLFFEFLRWLYEIDNRRTITIYLFIFCPVFFWVWANLHAGFPAGIILLGLFIFARTIKHWRGDRARALWFMGMGIASGILTLGVTLINPYGLHLYREIFSVAGSSETVRYIVEWRSGFIVSPTLNLVIWSGLYLWLLIFWRKHNSLFEIITTVIFFGFFAKSARMGPLWIVTTLPLLVIGLRLAKDSAKDLNSQKLPTLFFKAGIPFSAVILFSYAFWSYQIPVYPDRAVDFLKQQASRQANFILFNEYGWGGYLAERAPEIKVFIDGRMPHWIGQDGQGAMRDYVTLLYNGTPEEARAILARRGVNVVFLQNTSSPEEENKLWLYKIVPPSLRGSLANTYLAKIFEPLLRGGDKRNLITFLKAEGWRVLYSDQLAIILAKSEIN